MVRSSLALSVITGKPVRIFNLRARRKKPGLAKQHLTAVNAAAEICNAEVSGNELQSQDVSFNPGAVKPGNYHFKIGTAGSSTLVAQTVLPPLMIADAPSQIQIDGGTHNEKAPPYEFLSLAYLPLVQRMGPSFKSELRSHGFYPAGGGSIAIEIHPASSLAGISLTELVKKHRPQVQALVSKLPLKIADRECDKIRRKSYWDANRFESVEVTDSPGPGNVVMIFLKSEELTEVFSAVGKIGIKAEQVASQVYREANNYIKHSAPVGPHLADQLLLPMGLAAAYHGQTSEFVTIDLTEHTTTHVDILKRFLAVDVSVQIDSKLATIKVLPKTA